MNFYFITLGVLIFLITLFLFTGCHNKPEANPADLEKIIDGYCKSVSDGNYSLAYEKYLTLRYKKDIALSDFTSAHEKRKNLLGIILDKKITFMTKTRNIFSGLREFQFTYELKYKNATHHEVIKLNDEDGKFLIEGTYTRSSSDTLRFMVW